MRFLINTREDLDAIQGTKQHSEFMDLLKNSISYRMDVAVYPDDYNDPDYEGLEVEPVWEYREDLSLIGRFGLTKADFT